MRSLASLLPAAVGAAFLLLTAAGAKPPVSPKSPMPAFKAWEAAPIQVSGSRFQVPGAEGTLLDEVGRLSRRVTAAEVEGWKRELQGVPSSEFGVPRGAGQPIRSTIRSRSRSTKEAAGVRVARVHLWLGEYKLAGLEDPAGAYFHFRTIHRMSGGGPELARLKGRAVLNIAIGRFKQGAYEEAHHRFRKLLHPKTGLPGYDRREVAFWHRYAAACFGYHQRRERAGITEPEEIDPECGAASLAVILRSLGLPFDRKSALAACRVTGFGSSLQDLKDAAGKLGLAFHGVTLDEAGMKAIPKPVIVHVEHDHFVVLLKADDRGVTYGCSDCGSWPGGRREVSWAQWRLMEPGAVGAIYRRGSLADGAVSAAVGSGVLQSANWGEGDGDQSKSKITIKIKRGRDGGVRVTALPEVRGLLVGQVSPLSALTAALKGHVTAYLFTQGEVICGSHPDSLHCEPHVPCCMDCAQDSAVGNGTGLLRAMGGPSAGDPVNLATGEEEYTPPADLEVYNPTGPSVSWGRIYNSLRGLEPGYALDDFGSGWSHPYNVNLYDPTVRLNPQLVPGAAGSLTSTGTQAPGAGLTWDVLYGGSTVATSATPNGWNVALMMGSSAQVTPPAGATSGLNYLLRWKFVQFMQTYYFSASFDVRLVAEVPAGTTAKMAPTGSQLPGGVLSWEVRKSGTVIATSDLSNSWKVSFTPFPAELTLTAPLSEPAGGGYEARFRYMMGGLSATFSVLSHRYQAAGGTKYVIWPNGSRTAFSTATPPTAGNPTVLLPATSAGVPYFLRWDYSAADPLGVVSLISKDRSAWVFGQLAKHGAGPSVYRRPSAILDRLGNGIQLVYGPPAARYAADANVVQLYSGYPLLAAIKDGAGVDLLTFTRATDGTGSLLGVHDRYSRSVYYHVGVYNCVNVPTPHPTFYLQVDQVSQIVPTGTGSPPLRYTYGYTNVPIGHLQEECPFLTSITVPSPTGTGTATAGIQYQPDTCYVAALTDGNGNRREYSEFAADQTRVTVKNSLGVTLQSWTTRFNANMTHADRTDGTNSTLTEQHLYGDANAPHLASSIKDGMLRETLRSFDTFGNTLTETTPRGTQTVFIWDYNVFPMGRLMSIQEGSKTPTTFSYYEPSGLIATITTPKPGVSGQTVTRVLTYDGLGNPTTVTGPGNNAAATITATLNYTTDGPYSQSAKIGQPLTITNNLGHAEHFRYDARGNTVQTWDALGITTDLAYNLADQPLSVLNPATGGQGPGRSSSLNTYQYVGGPLANTKLYDEASALIRQVDLAYGPEGETLAVTGSTEPVSYAFDAAYRLKTLSDGKGNPTQYAYHVAGYLSLVTYPGGDTLSYPLYAADGSLLQRIDGRGIVANYLHNDPDGLLSNIQYPAFSALNVTMSYDSYARLSNMTDGQGSHGYAYDDNDNLTNETTTYTGLPAKAVGYTFHPDGSRATMTTPAGTFQSGYDAAQRMTSITNPFGETSGWTYLNNDWLKTQSLHNGAKATWTYNALGLPTDLENRQGPNPTDPLLSSFTGMVYDGAANRLSMTATIPAHPAYSGTNGYQYDTKDQLTQETSTRAGGYTNGFGYDPAGNPTTFKGVPATFNSNNQRSSDTHDGEGNPTTYKGVTCTFDPENRLTAYGTVMTAGYRGDGLRAWKQTAAGRVYFLYDGEVLLAELSPTGAVTAVNTWGAAGLVSRNSASTTVYYTFDPQGSVTQRQDGAGAVLTSHVWEAHGTGAASGPFVDAYGYAGQVGYLLDEETALYLCTFRYYDPARGRFLNRDPIGYQGGANVYAHALNNPVSLSDARGLKPGDSYKTKDEAAKQAIRDYNPPSIKSNREYMGYIYVLPKGKGFSYTKGEPKEGRTGHGGGFKSPGTCVGYYHTHGATDPRYNNEEFSGRDPVRSDKAEADRLGLTAYLGTPKGRILRYDPDPRKQRNGKVTEIGTM